MLKAGRQEREGKGAKLDAHPAVELILKLHPEKTKINEMVNDKW